MKMLCKESFKKMEENYLFSLITEEVEQYRKEHPLEKVISLGIGDVTLPLPQTVVDAMQKAALDMGTAENFRGYAPQRGYGFLREALQRQYQKWGCEIRDTELFVTDGAKSALADIFGLFRRGRVLLPTPCYPVYADLAKMEGFSMDEVEGNKENGFLPLPPTPSKKGYLIFLCSPQNPTGVAYSREDLQKWVGFAKDTGSLILFDAAYESFATPDLPHSIFEIEGARDCAIEIGSFSKSAGFTGVRCGWVVMPEGLRDGEGSLVYKRWTRLRATTHNGVSYITQRGAEAALSPKGQEEIRERILYYLENAAKIRSVLVKKGMQVYGGVVSPYLWVSLPKGGGSWEIFKNLLYSCQVVTTPGVGFGKAGEGYVRLSSFGRKEDVEEATKRLWGLSFS